MHDSLKALVLRFFKVPPEPAAPAGSPASVRIFRAADNFYKLNLLKWGLAQIAILLGLGVLLVVALTSDLQGPAGLFIRVLGLLGLFIWLAQLPLSYFLVRLDYEMRWYIVTDRSLRIRHGIQQVREMTLTFANIQQITMRQGPLQRLLGIADLEVRTAGGGGSSPLEGGGAGHHGMTQSMHLGYFRGVNNAEAIRDLILERLRRLRDSGLGDPDDLSEEESSPGAKERELLAAARELLQEARALRQACP